MTRIPLRWKKVDEYEGYPPDTDYDDVGVYVQLLDKDGRTVSDRVAWENKKVIRLSISKYATVTQALLTSAEGQEMARCDLSAETNASRGDTFDLTLEVNGLPT